MLAHHCTIEEREVVRCGARYSLTGGRGGNEPLAENETMNHLLCAIVFNSYHI